MKLIIDVEKDYYEMIKHNVEHGQEYKPFEIIANGIPYDERPQGEWTPVSERLPEERINPHTNDFEEVLCSTDWGEVLTFKFGTPILHHEPHFWLGGAIMDEHIIAWQPLPEPYKKGGAV